MKKAYEVRLNEWLTNTTKKYQRSLVELKLGASVCKKVSKMS